MNRLVVENLTKKYGSTTALDDLSFSASEGEIVGLLGPNGAGKTTALHIILGVIRPTAGRVSIFGLSPFQDRYKIYPRINFSSAYAQLPFNLRVVKNLEIFADLYGVSNSKKKIEDLLDQFNIKNVADHVTGSLSSGEHTRLNLCKSLLNDPEILFLDEPTASLDPDIGERVRATLKQIQKDRKITILYTSHNMAEVEAMCDRIVFIHHGRKIVEGTPHEIREKFKKDSLEKVFIQLVRSGDVMSLDKGEEIIKP